MKSFLSKFQKLVLIFIRKLQNIRTDKVAPVIVTYPLYGNKSKTRVYGRVVEEIKKYDFSKSKSKLVHFFQVIKLFVTIKHEDAHVEIDAGGQPVIVKTNEEGFFYSVVDYIKDSTVDDAVTFKINSLKKTKKTLKKERTFKSLVMRPTKHTKKIIISDIDDTVLMSKATDFTRMALRTLFYTVSKRRTFPDAAKAYIKMKEGSSKDEENLFFYVSSSTWNIFPLLQDFLKINNFPDGVLLLQDVISEKKKEHENSHGHKLDRINEISDLYSDLKLILIGDAGQQDPEIYLQIAEKDPSRVDKILIRNTWWSRATDNSGEYLKRAKSLGVDMRYFDTLDETN